MDESLKQRRTRLDGARPHQLSTAKEDGTLGRLQELIAGDPTRRFEFIKLLFNTVFDQQKAQRVIMQTDVSGIPLVCAINIFDKAFIETDGYFYPTVAEAVNEIYAGVHRASELPDKDSEI